MIKLTIQKEDKTLVKIYAPNIGVPKYNANPDGHKGKYRNKDINRNTVIVSNFNTPLTSKDKSSRHKINNKTVALKD